MTDTTPRASVPLLSAAQAQKHVTHNDALLEFDALLCCRILDRDLTDPPATPVDGDTYLVKATGTGIWAGQDGNIAYVVDGGWRFYAPFEGLTAFIADEAVMLVYTASGWVDWASVLNLQNLPLLGVNTAADSTNKFALKSNAALFAALEAANGGTGDAQLKFSKEASGNTASLLYQTNYSGRAEIGLTGDDDFSIKVSPDGAAWTTALKIDKSSGQVLFADGADVTPSLAFQNDPTTGFFRVGSGAVRFQSAGTPGVIFDVSGIRPAGGGTPQFLNAIGSDVTPTFAPNRSDLTSGVGGDGSGSVTLITAGAANLYAKSGKVGIATTSPSCVLDVNGDHLRLRTAKTPATATATGNAGDICWDANYLYVCTAANTWKRAALASW